MKIGLKFVLRFRIFPQRIFFVHNPSEIFTTFLMQERYQLLFHEKRNYFRKWWHKNLHSKCYIYGGQLEHSLASKHLRSFSLVLIHVCTFGQYFYFKVSMYKPQKILVNIASSFLPIRWLPEQKFAYKKFFSTYYRYSCKANI